MNELITIDAAKAGAQFSEAVRNARALMADCHDDIVRDLLQVKALQMVAEALTPEMRALILVAGKQGSFEVVQIGDHKIKDEQIVNVCVEAYAKGLRLCDRHFGAFGDTHGNAKLYVKKNGFRQWFRDAERANRLQYNVSDFKTVTVDKDKYGRARGRVLIYGIASVEWDGKKENVEATEQYPIRKKWAESDSQESIVAKGERGLLAKLWEQCTGISEVDVDEIDGGPVEESVEVEPVATVVGRNWTAEREAYRKEWTQLSDAAKPVYAELMKAENDEDLQKAVAAQVSLKMPAKDREAFIRAVAWQRERIEAAGTVPAQDGGTGGSE